MSTLDFSPPDYALLDGGEDYLEDDPTVEVVRWYDRPGWPLGGMQPSIAIAGAFILGLAVGAAVATGVGLLRDRDDD
jgi:hypothetical protein